MYKGRHLFHSVSLIKLYGTLDYVKVANPYFEGIFVWGNFSSIFYSGFPDDVFMVELRNELVFLILCKK